VRIFAFGTATPEREVLLKPANEAVENRPKREPTMIAPNSPLRIFVMMTVSFVLE
jgi:hypothetical protein